MFPGPISAIPALPNANPDGPGSPPPPPPAVFPPILPPAFCRYCSLRHPHPRRHPRRHARAGHFRALRFGRCTGNAVLCTASQVAHSVDVARITVNLTAEIIPRRDPYFSSSYFQVLRITCIAQRCFLFFRVYSRNGENPHASFARYWISGFVPARVSSSCVRAGRRNLSRECRAHRRLRRIRRFYISQNQMGVPDQSASAFVAGGRRRHRLFRQQ